MTSAEAQIKDWRENVAKFAWDNFQFKPDLWQQEVFDLFPSTNPEHRRIAMQACVGPGKTAVLAILILNFMACYGKRGSHPKGACVSITADNLRDNLWAEIAKLLAKSPFLSKAFTQNADRLYANDHPDTWFFSARSFSKKANGEEQGRTLSGLHGEFVLLVADETGDMPIAVGKAADQIFANVIPFAKIVMAGNPSSTAGLLYEATIRNRTMWAVVRITGDPEDPKRSPRISLEWAKEQIAKYGRDNPWIMYSILGLFPPTAINQLIGPEDVEKAWARAPREADVSFAQRRLGCDVALEGDDRTVIVPRQGIIAYQPVILRTQDPAVISARLIRGHKTWDSDVEFVDNTGGWGSGVVSHAKMAGREVIPVGFAEAADEKELYHNKRAEMWWRMAEWVKKEGALPRVSELMQELTAPTYTLRNGRLLLEPKDMIKKRLGFSPDCFVAGTQVLTPKGNRAIESIEVGDEVCTPVGTRKVIKNWITETQSLTTVQLSNGASLTGKGKHEIFTWNSGWVRLDSLTPEHQLEPGTWARRLAWTLQRKFSTGEIGLGFKARVGTIRPTERICRSDFFTGSFGLKQTALSLTGITSTIRTMIGPITGLKISNACLAANTFEATCSNEWQNLFTGPERSRLWTLPGRKLQNGTEAKKGKNGIANMEKKVGCADLQLRSSVRFARRFMKLISRLAQGFAPNHASKKKLFKGQRLRLRNALYVARNFISTNIGLKPVVPVSVQTDYVGRSLVYNLTLDRDNVYYANGILVANCADALALTFALPELPRKQKEFHRSVTPSEMPETRASEKFHGDYDPMEYI